MGVGVFMLLVADGLSGFEGLDLDCPEDVGDLLNAPGSEFIDHQVPVNACIVAKDPAKRIFVGLDVSRIKVLIGHALD